MRPLVLSALVAGALAAPAHAASLPAVDSGHRPGPDLLYAAPPGAPQMETARPWRADPILVSGATAYRDGEFLYQDFLYDDHGAAGSQDPDDPFSGLEFLFSPKHGTLTYPTDPAFASNAADLVELRVKPLDDATAFRITLNTLADPGRTAVTIALGSSPAPMPWPHGANVLSPAELFLTVHGTTGELVEAAGDGAARAPAPSVTVDERRRQFDVRVPHAAWDPGTATVRMAAGVGLWDPDGDAYLAPNPGRASATTPGGGSPSESGLFNLAFRTNEPIPKISEPGAANTIVEGGAGVKADGSWWRERAQGDALATGDVSAFFAEVDFAKLAAGADDDSGVPRDGHLNRILVSRFDNGKGVDHERKCLIANVTEGDPAPPCTGRFLGQLQPYAIYVPRKPPPARGYGITLAMHGLSANHNEFLGSRNAEQFGERGGGSIVASPLGRGPDGQYMAYAEADVFEMWADVARHYPLDPDWAAVSGYSMGGEGTYRLGGRWPDLFARAFPIVGPLFGDAAYLPGLRNVPLMAWYAGQDELVSPALAEQARSEMNALGLRYDWRMFSPAGHITLGNNDEYGPAAEFLGEHRVDRAPPHVTYVLRNERTEPLGASDHAYWLSGLRLREGAAEGTIDARSHAFGVGDPPPLEEEQGGGTLEGGSHGPLPFVRRARGWGDAPAEPKANRLDLVSRGITAVTVDVVRARVGCDVDLRVDSDVPMAVTLAGCDRTVRVGSGLTRVACQSRRRFYIHPPRRVRGRKVLKVRVVVNGRPVRVRRDRRRRFLALVDLRGLPAGRYTVRIVSRLRGGRVVRAKRAYRTCRPGAPRAPRPRPRR
ncbi:MAG TPA: hypothetical protein VF529_07840 [Solirubrobacteraceae bacterium]|jgi:predicted esterase